MTELLPLSVGVGLLVGLLMADVCGIIIGAMILPGYVALNMHQPHHLIATLVASLATSSIVRLLGQVARLYKRRKAALTILIGYLIGAGLHRLTSQVSLVFGTFLSAQAIDDFQVVGFVLPGILALWLERQNITEVCCTLLTASVLVRLILILLVDSEMLV